MAISLFYLALLKRTLGLRFFALILILRENCFRVSGNEEEIR